MRRGYSKRDTGWLLGAAAVAATLAAVLPSYLAGTAAVPSAPALAPRPAPAQVMAPTTPSPATFGQIEKGGLQPHRLPPLKLSPPYEVADGLTILTETRRIRLAGLEGPRGEAACFDEGDRLWACGLQARAALHNHIRNQAVTCRPTGQSLGEAVLAECSVGLHRIDNLLVREGFARPLTPGLLQQELTEARSGTRGLWNGRWRIRP